MVSFTAGATFTGATFSTANRFGEKKMNAALTCPCFLRLSSINWFQPWSLVWQGPSVWSSVADETQPPSIFSFFFFFFVFALLFSSFSLTVWVTVWTGLMMWSQFRLSNIGRLPQQYTGTSGCRSGVLTWRFLQIKIRKWGKPQQSQQETLTLKLNRD